MEQDNVVERFHQRRDARLSIEAYRKRRDERNRIAEDIKWAMDADWDENKHPRGKGGKFAKKGTGGGSTGENEKSNEKGLTALQKSSKIQSTKGKKTPDMLKDEENAKAWIGKVNSVKSNEYKPFVKEAINLEKVAKEAQVNMSEAREASYACDDFCNKMAKIEPKITQDVVKAVSGLGGTMYGLDFRMKQPTSLTRKVLQDSPIHATAEDIERTLKGINDGCRYTAIFDDDSFTENYNKTKQKLEELGYKEVRCKNFWAMYDKGTSVQKAIQCVYLDPSGNRFELQFHTADSQGVKEVNHPLYEEARQTGVEANRVKELEDRMRNIGLMVKNPKGVFDIAEHNDFKKEG